MIRFDFMIRYLLDFKATFDLFWWRLGKGQRKRKRKQIKAASVARYKATVNSIHSQITAPNNEWTALKNTWNVIWDTLKSLDFSSDSARLASPSAVIPFSSLLLAQLPVRVQRRPHKAPPRKSWHRRLQLAMLCHLLSLPPTCYKKPQKRKI